MAYTEVDSGGSGDEEPRNDVHLQTTYGELKAGAPALPGWVVGRREWRDLHRPASTLGLGSGSARTPSRRLQPGNLELGSVMRALERGILFFFFLFRAWCIFSGRKAHVEEMRELGCVCEGVLLPFPRF